MNYLFLKARLELIRALKPFFPKAAYVARLEESSRALRRYWARPTQTIDLQGFLRLPRKCKRSNVPLIF